MRSVRRGIAVASAFAISLAVAVSPLGGSSRAEAKEAIQPRAIVLLLRDVSFEELMAVPEMRQLARAGGAGLMSVRTTDQDEGAGSYLTLGAGTRTSGPRLALRPEGGCLTRAVAVDVGLEPVFACPRDAAPSEADVLMGSVEKINDGDSIPGLLAHTLESEGFSTSDLWVAGGSGEVAPGVLMAMNDQGQAALSASPFLQDSALAIVDMDTLMSGLGDKGLSNAGVLDKFSAFMKTLISADPASPLLVMVVAPKTSPSMDSAKDELTPIVMAEGSGEDLFPANGEVGTLTSDSTHRNGVVSNEDVAPTILQFFDVPVPVEMHGAPIRIVRGAGAPFGLHQRHLDARPLWLPVQVAATTGVVIVMLLIGLCAFLRRRGREKAGPIGAYLSLTFLPLGSVLLAAGSLPVLNAWTVGLTVLVVTFGLPAIAMRFHRRNTLLPPAIVGAVILVYLVIENAFGWPSMLTTFLGGTGLDGARFYGIPNVDVGVALGAVMWMVPILRTKVEGFVLILLVAFLVALPWFGANHEVALFFAAGLWLALDGTWRRLTWRRVLIVLAVGVIGIAIVFFADSITFVPTHGTRFLQEPGISGVFSKIADRLEVGFRLLALNPIGILYLLAMPLLLLLTIRPRRGMRAVLEAEPRWRAAIATVLAASIVAFLLNDTGVSAAGFGFAAGAAGLAYISLVRPRPVVEDEPHVLEEAA